MLTSVLLTKGKYVSNYYLTTFSNIDLMFSNCIRLTLSKKVHSHYPDSIAQGDERMLFNSNLPKCHFRLGLHFTSGITN